MAHVEGFPTVAANPSKIVIVNDCGRASRVVDEPLRPSVGGLLVLDERPWVESREHRRAQRL